MLRYSAAELQRQLGHIQDQALKEPVTITRHGRDRLVILDAEEFKQLRKRARVAMSVEELSDDDIKQIEQTSMPPKHNHLNAELESTEKV